MNHDLANQTWNKMSEGGRRRPGGGGSGSGLILED
jgi:hypothetical protein